MLISNACHGSNKESERTDWKTWRPWYERIASDFGYDAERDRKATGILSRLLEDRKNVSEEELASLLRGREAVVFGPAAPHISDLKDQVNIAAGSGLSAMLDLEIVPDMVVTDLDGDLRYQVEANDKGAIVVIHAHGDNINALKEWVPRFGGLVFGTTQVEPKGNIHNFGGFTDGDRAVFLAAHFGAGRILLQGFDLDKPVSKPGGKLAVKQRKLAYAKELIALANNEYDCDIINVASR